jgi:putative transport protein
MNIIIDFLKDNIVFLLFIVIALGYIIAKIKIKGFTLGIASVLFVGIAFGSISESLVLPDAVYIIGLIFFIYTTGLQSGPGFFASFNKVGLSFNILVVFSLSVTAGFVFVLRKFMDLKPMILSGLYAGALTNTPSIASIVDHLKRSNLNLSSHEMSELLGEPVAGFSVAYPFGVIGVILCFQLFKLLFQVNVEKESRKIANQLGLGGEELEHLDVLVQSDNVHGKSVRTIFSENKIQGLIISRIKKGKDSFIVKGETVLENGNIITLVGSFETIKKNYKLFGTKLASALSEERGVLDYRRIFVSNKDVVGLSIRDLNIREKFDATITRLKRGDSEIVPT